MKFELTSAIIVSLINIIGKASTFPLDAECSMRSSKGIHGDIFITQEDRDGPLSFNLDLQGFNMNNTANHGMMVHEAPFDTGNCGFVGDPYNPFANKSIDAKQFSDLGKINVLNGISKMTMVTNDMLLFGLNGIAGRTLGIHENNEDSDTDDERLSWTYKQPIACCRILFSMASSAPSLHINGLYYTVFTLRLIRSILQTILPTYGLWISATTSSSNIW